MLRRKLLYASALLARIGVMPVNLLQIQRPTDWLKNR